jgi:hypothetical protein
VRVHARQNDRGDSGGGRKPQDQAESRQNRRWDADEQSTAGRPGQHRCRIPGQSRGGGQQSRYEPANCNASQHRVDGQGRALAEQPPHGFAKDHGPARIATQQAAEISQVENGQIFFAQALVFKRPDAFRRKSRIEGKFVHTEPGRESSQGRGGQSGDQKDYESTPDNPHSRAS